MTKIIIRAVPNKRVDFVDYLRRKLPDAVMCWHEGGDAMTTFLKAMRMAEGKPVVHMEDDVILTKNFLPKLEAAIAEKPNALINFFSMRKADIEIGSRWDRKFSMNQCHYNPAGLSEAFADYEPHWPRRDEHPTGYDYMMADFMKERKKLHWIHCANLVEHRECKSITDPRRSSRRHSKTFMDPDE